MLFRVVLALFLSLQLSAVADTNNEIQRRCEAALRAPENTHIDDEIFTALAVEYHQLRQIYDKSKENNTTMPADKEARMIRLGKRLVGSHVDFARKRARDLCKHLHPERKEGCISEAYVGLAYAITKFDPEKSKFTTYANTWITHYIKTYVRSNRFVVYVDNPKDMYLISNFLRKQVPQIVERLRRTSHPNASETELEDIAIEELMPEATERYDASRDVVTRAVDFWRNLREVSTDASSSWSKHSGKERTLGETFQSETLNPLEGLDRIRENRTMQRALKALIEWIYNRPDSGKADQQRVRDIRMAIVNKRIIREIDGIEKRNELVSNAEIGKDFSVSRERIRQYEEELKERLRVEVIWALATQHRDR